MSSLLNTMLHIKLSVIVNTTVCNAAKRNWSSQSVDQSHLTCSQSVFHSVKVKSVSKVMCVNVFFLGMWRKDY